MRVDVIDSETGETDHYKIRWEHVKVDKNFGELGDGSTLTYCFVTWEGVTIDTMDNGYVTTAHDEPFDHKETRRRALIRALRRYTGEFAAQFMAAYQDYMSNPWKYRRTGCAFTI